jgi:K+-sensing histidine kinase KdpD
MEKPNPHNFDRDLDAVLSQGRHTSVPGFADRVVTAVRADRRRRSVIRWSSAFTTAAACVLTVLVLSRPSDEALARQTRELLARENSAQLSEILGLADDLSVLAPVVDKTTLVDVLASPGS